MSSFDKSEYLSHLVDGITAFKIKDIGSHQWLECNQKMILLLKSVNADFKEVAELLISRGKLPIVVHELHCAKIWRRHVLPHLLEIGPHPKSRLMNNIVTEYEHIMRLLLNLVIADPECCRALKNSAIDLIDYCVEGMNYIIGLINVGEHANYIEINSEELDYTSMQKNNERILDFIMGCTCTTILNNIAEYFTSLPAIPPSILHRLVITHDIPWLMADLLQLKPWQRLTKNGMEKVFGTKWTKMTKENEKKVTDYEMSTWACMSNLLCDTTIQQYYSLNNERRNHFAKCTDLLNVHLIDQVPELIHLKVLLLLFNETDLYQNKSTLNLEVPPTIHDQIFKQAESDGGFNEIAKIHELIFRMKDMEALRSMGEPIVKSLDDLAAEYDDVDEKEKEKSTVVKNCALCGSCATKKCGKCLVTYYCAKKCQLEDWAHHRLNCTKK